MATEPSPCGSFHGLILLCVLKLNYRGSIHWFIQVSSPVYLCIEHKGNGT